MFGEFLIRHGVIDRDQLMEALAKQNGLGKPLGETLVNLGYLEQTLLEEYLEKHLMTQAEILVGDPEIAI